MYAAYKVCSHTVEAAEASGILIRFTEWLATNKCSPNLSNLSMTGIPRGPGQKGGVPKVTRKLKRPEKMAVQAKKKVVDRLSTVVSSPYGSPNSPRSSYVYTQSATHGPVNVNGQRALARSYNYSIPLSPPPPPLSPPPNHWSNDWGTMPPFPALFVPSTSMNTSFPLGCHSASYSNSVVSSYPFRLQLLTPRIKICQ